MECNPDLLLLVEPDVRISRIRLSCSLSMQGSRQELRAALALQVGETVSLQASVEGLPLPKRSAPPLAPVCFALHPSFHRRRERRSGRPPSGRYAPAGSSVVEGWFNRHIPSSMETRLKCGPLAPRTLLRFLATMGRSDFRPQPRGRLWIPYRRCPVIPAGTASDLPGSCVHLSTRALPNHPGRLGGCPRSLLLRR